MGTLASASRETQRAEDEQKENELITPRERDDISIVLDYNRNSGDYRARCSDQPQQWTRWFSCKDDAIEAIWNATLRTRNINLNRLNCEVEPII